MSKKIGPHTYKLGEGQVTFSYMTKAEADEHFKAIKSKAPAEPPPTSQGLGSLIASKDNRLALGLFEANNKYNLVTIEYNPVTLVSVIQAIEELGSMRAYANKTFQIAAVKKGIIK